MAKNRFGSKGNDKKGKGYGEKTYGTKTYGTKSYGEKSHGEKTYGGKKKPVEPKKYKESKKEVERKISAPIEVQEIEEEKDRIEGRNPVMEALKADREIDKILVAKGATEGSIQKIMGMAKDKKIPVQIVERQKINELASSGAHQGVIAFAAMKEYVELEDILESVKKKKKTPFFIILDEIMDPHNLGSILRTADGAGVDGIIIPKRRAVGLTATVAKTSAGAIEYVPVAKVSNISQTIDKLQKMGVWVTGADMSAENHYYEANMTGPIALVIGSEGAGISRLIKEKCDFLVKLPMAGQLNSLNASVAAGVLMYEVLRQRTTKL